MELTSGTGHRFPQLVARRSEGDVMGFKGEPNQRRLFWVSWDRMAAVTRKGSRRCCPRGASLRELDGREDLWQAREIEISQRDLHQVASTRFRASIGWSRIVRRDPGPLLPFLFRRRSSSGRRRVRRLDLRRRKEEAANNSASSRLGRLTVPAPDHSPPKKPILRSRTNRRCEEQKATLRLRFHWSGH